MSARLPLVAGLLLVAAALGALCLGTPVVAPSRLPDLLAGGGAGAGTTGAGALDAVVVREIRLPRLLLAAAAGACLGAAGLVLQEALRNPLAVPEMLGVSSGAALGVAAPLVLVLPLPGWAHPLLAVGGAALGGLLTLAAAGFGRSPSAVLLTGAAVAAALQAGLLVMMVMADRLDLQLIFRYLMGSLSGRGWDAWGGVWPWAAAAVPLLVLCLPVLAVLRLGDADAGALGVRVHRARLAALAVAVLLIAPVVAVCGPVAWIGFLAPHLARRLRPGADVVGWLPWAAAWGAVVTVWADLAARLALAPVETPVGAWTALVGVPAGVLLMRSGRTGPRAAVATATAAAGTAAAADTGHGGDPPPEGSGAGAARTPPSGGPAPRAQRESAGTQQKGGSS
ncbi:FecCD family ABC transporter permease [Streptomyces sp. HB2AG]|uniref:FecCD family ABC transporter permease n=1 Tax=Streptomyces sp. HB2AG TaxID=2983400 RepID=UPI0022AA8CEB|nr:iron ABC transporter permease [Streptomyces sp. HB2AG]MCZ2527084.1 iron ABC transporter permease [Streptomyces sp. HB2AG]